MSPKKPVTLPLAGSKSTPPPQSFTDFHRKEQQEPWRRGASSCPRGKAEKAQPLLLQTSRTTLPLVRVNFSQPCHEIGPISDTSICGLVCRAICGSFSGDGCAELGAGAPSPREGGALCIGQDDPPLQVNRAGPYRNIKSKRVESESVKIWY